MRALRSGTGGARAISQTHTFSRTSRKTTDKCRRRRPRKVIRFSAHAPHPENSCVIADSPPARRPMRKVSSECGVYGTISDPKSYRAGPTPVPRFPKVRNCPLHQVKPALHGSKGSEQPLTTDAASRACCQESTPRVDQLALSIAWSASSST
jgi:hypothetical protein